MAELIETIISPIIIAAIVSAAITILLELYKKRLEIRNIQKELIDLLIDVREKYLKLTRNYDVIEYIKDHEWEDKQPKDTRDYINFESIDEDFFNLHVSFIKCSIYIACSLKLTKKEFKPLVDGERYLNELKDKQTKLSTLKEISSKDLISLFELLKKVREKIDDISPLIAFSKYRI